MKRSLNVLAAALLVVSLHAGATAPGQTRPASAPAAASEPVTVNWLLAQDRRMPTCKLDNRDVPVGTTMCQKKRVWVCERGQWVDSGKPC